MQEVPRLAAEVPPGDDGYVTVQDASRPALMYNVQDADPGVIALDIATKETNTLGEIATLRVRSLSTRTALDRPRPSVVDTTDG